MSEPKIQPDTKTFSAKSNTALIICWVALCIIEIAVESAKYCRAQKIPLSTLYDDPASSLAILSRSAAPLIFWYLFSAFVAFLGPKEKRRRTVHIVFIVVLIVLILIGLL